MSIERLSIDKPNSIRSKSPRPQPTSSAVQVNEESDNLELTDRTGKPSETSTQIVDLPPNSNVYRTRARMQFASVCFSMFLAGWNDGTTGPLLPRIQKVYHVGFVVVSLIFAFACIGFASGALLNLYISERLGFGKVLALGSAFQIIAYCICASAPPFPVLVFGYLVNGLGMALQDAQTNGYVANLKKNAETKMGVLHAVYGAGALAAPLVSTQFAQADRWSFHYLCSFGLAFLNMVSLIAVFRFKRQEVCLVQIGQEPEERGNSQSDSQFKQIFGLKAVHLMAFFILVYVGVEVTIGGWIVTFVIDVRHGGPSAGYISSGFFGGLMVGRVALLRVNRLVGERRALFIYAVLAIGLELVIWLVPSLVGGAVAVSTVGVLLGPMYPILMTEATRILPRWLLTESIGWIAGFGATGSAVLPFMTGALASKFGIKSLPPLVVAMMSFMIGLWYLVPAGPRRVE